MVRSLRVASVQQNIPECSILQRMINETAACWCQPGLKVVRRSSFLMYSGRAVQTHPPVGGVQIHLEAGQQPASDIILRPVAVCQNETGCLTHRYTNTCAQTPAIRIRWRRKPWEGVKVDLGNVFISVQSSVLIGRGLWVPFVKWAVYMKCEKQRSVKNKKCQMVTDGLLKGGGCRAKKREGAREAAIISTCKY